MSDGEAPRKSIRKTRKKRFKKDPNAPKRPMTGYFIFMQSARDKVKADNPELKLTEVSKALGEKWKYLESKKKQEYLDLASEQREAYKVKYEEYLASDEKREYDIAKKAWQKEQKQKEKKARQKAKAKAQRQQQQVDDYEDEEDDEEDEYVSVSDE